MLESVAFALLGTLCVGSISVWIKFFRNQKKGVATLPVRLREPKPIGLLDILVMFSGWIFAQMAASGIALALMEFEAKQVVSLAASGIAIAVSGLEAQQMSDASAGQRWLLVALVGIAQLLITLACMAVFRLRYQSSRLFGAWGTLGKDIRIGLLAFIFFVPPLLILQAGLTHFVDYEHGTLNSLKNANSVKPFFSAWFTAVLVAPFIEEVFFRGLIQSWLQRLGNTNPEDFGKLMIGGWFSSDPPLSGKTRPIETVPNSDGNVYFDSELRWLPIFISAGLFAAAHAGQGAAPIPLFFLGVGLGYLFRQTGSIVPCIVVHFLLNFYSMFWATMYVIFSQGA